MVIGRNGQKQESFASEKSLLNGLSCRSYSGSLQDWNWLAGMALEEISSSSPTDVSAVVYPPNISVFPSLLIPKKR